ncbi:hypothetical protein K469DRAFT_691797 [Zopfia rhizophila CBS 207.26]|uniref:Uncharacterized protein n=1 Tax=Zopfia rhizophila CBS 207.26 TaxID=1314779 RepID=A0A6A6DQ45_9PEZI|nr:hypothetical protein K469DRAFT_691797 [Zopfia rhizophila CBS 207.26]
MQQWLQKTGQTGGPGRPSGVSYEELEKHISKYIKSPEPELPAWLGLQGPSFGGARGGFRGVMGNFVVSPLGGGGGGIGAGFGRFGQGAGAFNGQNPSFSDFRQQQPNAQPAADADNPFAWFNPAASQAQNNILQGTTVAGGSSEDEADTRSPVTSRSTVSHSTASGPATSPGRGRGRARNLQPTATQPQPRVQLAVPVIPASAYPGGDTRIPPPGTSCPGLIVIRDSTGKAKWFFNLTLNNPAPGVAGKANATIRGREPSERKTREIQGEK